MALINPPTWMQGGSYPARSDRLALTALLAYPGFLADESTPMRIRQGVKPSYQQYQLKVRPAPTPNMTVIVSAGFAFIDQHDTGGVGTYICVNDGDVTLTVQPAGGAGQYRRDTVVASVYDAEYAGSASEWRLEVVQGPYAASAGATVRGSLPPNAQILADIAIGPSQTSVAAGNITDVRQYSVAAGGIVPVSSSGAPTRLHPGQMIYLTDADRFVYGTQSGPSKDLLQQAWTAYTPTWTTAGTAPNIGNGMIRGSYCRIGKTVHARISLIAGSTTTFGTSSFRLGLPFATAALENGGFYHVGTAMYIDDSAGADYPGTAFAAGGATYAGLSSSIGGTSTQPGSLTATQPFTWANGDSMHVQITYEAA